MFAKYNMKSRRYTKDDIIYHTANVKSMAGLLKKLGLRPVGGNYSNMRRILDGLQIKRDHWTGQGWSANQQMKVWAEYKNPKNLKRHVIQERGHRCEVCKKKKWCGDLIPLELHHINGDSNNNDAVNLQLCCCNCHAQTDTWRRRKAEVNLSPEVISQHA